MKHVSSSIAVIMTLVSLVFFVLPKEASAHSVNLELHTTTHTTITRSSTAECGETSCFSRIKPIAAAAIGGCRENWGGPNNSFEMGVCISDRGTSGYGYTIYPDVYVNQQAPGWNWTCSLYIEVWDNSYRELQSGPYPCVQNHYGSQLSWFSSVGWLHTSVWISFNGTFYRIGDSPTYYYVG